MGIKNSFHNPSRRLLLAILVILTALNIACLFLLWDLDESTMRVRIFHTGWLLAVWGYSLLLYLLGQWYNQDLPRRTSLTVVVTGVVALLFSLWPFAFDDITAETQYEGSLLFPYQIRYGWSSRLFFGFMLLMALHAVYHTEKLYRSVAHGPRFQWSLFTLIGTLCFWMVLDSLALMYRYLNADALVVALTPSLVVNFLLGYHVIKKNRQYQLQVSRVTLYNSVTLLVSGLFLLALGFMGEIIRLIGARLNFFLAFLAAFAILCVFLMVLLFRSVRSRVQTFIGRNFYKNIYDYRAEWERANRRILPIDNSDALQREVLNAVMEPTRAKAGALLLCDTMDQFFIAISNGLQLQSEQVPEEIFDWIWRNGKPIKLEQIDVDGIDLTTLRENDVHIVMPVISEHQLIGLILLTSGERKYAQEDLDFLETIGGQISLALTNQKNRESLIESEELKNFNRLSAFILHDLKNAASMLSMVIQNAGTNMDNPEFRTDMIRTMNGVIERIRRLISKLSTPPEQKPQEFRSTDLKALIGDTLKTTGIDNLSRIQLHKDLADVPPVFGAFLELQKVLHNLLMNAVESIEDTGDIRIKLERCHEEVYIEVKDTGCGISQEFINNSLFKPFHTTKEKGLGIGLYQCKTIVEAHGGRIEVESTPGTGTRFRVFFP